MNAHLVGQVRNLGLILNSALFPNPPPQTVRITISSSKIWLVSTHFSASLLPPPLLRRPHAPSDEGGLSTVSPAPSNQKRARTHTQRHKKPKGNQSQITSFPCSKGKIKLRGKKVRFVVTRGKGGRKRKWMKVAKWHRLSRKVNQY